MREIKAGMSKGKAFEGRCLSAIQSCLPQGVVQVAGLHWAGLSKPWQLDSALVAAPWWWRPPVGSKKRPIRPEDLGVARLLLMLEHKHKKYSKQDYDKLGWSILCMLDMAALYPTLRCGVIYTGGWTDTCLATAQNHMDLVVHERWEDLRSQLKKKLPGVLAKARRGVVSRYWHKQAG